MISFPVETITIFNFLFTTRLLIPIEDAKRQLDVNVISQISITQAFLPAIRKAQGRIVFISSVSGMIVFPLLGMYAASKHALEAIGDGFRRELKKWDIKVSIIEPGSMKTPIWNKTLNRGNSQMKKLPKEKKRFESQFQSWGFSSHIYKKIRNK